jgi:hypothetical protein
MREVGHADKSVNDRYTHPLEQAHLAASEQTAALVRNAFPWTDAPPSGVNLPGSGRHAS